MSNKLKRDLERYERMVMDAVRDIVRDTLELLKTEILERVPIDTGWLRESVDYTIAADGLSGTLLIDCDYAVYVNFGTGIYATGPGGSRAVRIPWVYYNERWGRFVVTYGQKPQNFWDPAIEEAAKYYHREIKRLKHR